mmetsp:Transcript_94061/g.165952  ORF Transcript_94061/g.165952 Transcript_94061/m.165952 type:complete len:302 (-) Transcript_94061:83-988(-)
MRFTLGALLVLVCMASRSYGWGERASREQSDSYSAASNIKLQATEVISGALADPWRNLAMLLLAFNPSGAGAASKRPRCVGRLPESPVALAEVGLMGVVDEWFQSYPYSSAFCVTAFKATMSDLLAQWRERKAVSGDLPDSMVTCDDLSCEVVDVEAGISGRRTLAFLLYGGLYQGCVQHFLYNECFPAWFGSNEDLQTVATKVFFDQCVHSPLLALPAAYMFKAMAFNYPLHEGLERYMADAKCDLIFRCWTFWVPVQFATFGVIPEQWRIAFIALASFFWLITLSTISSRSDALAVSRQ